LEAGPASVFRQEAPNLLDPEIKLLCHWVPQKHSTNVDKLLRTGHVHWL